MNQYHIQGSVLHIEMPKKEGKSGLLLMQIGKISPDLSKIVQPTNKVMMRFPNHLSARCSSLKGGDIIEVIGNLDGIAKRSMSGGDPFMYVELTAHKVANIVVVGKGALINRFTTSGVIMAIEPPSPTIKDGKGRPAMIFVRSGPVRRSDGRMVEHTSTLNIPYYGKTADDRINGWKAFSPGQAVNATGRLGGVLRRVPGDGGYHESLEPTLMGITITKVAAIPRSCFVDKSGDGEDKELPLPQIQTPYFDVEEV